MTDTRPKIPQEPLKDLILAANAVANKWEQVGYGENLRRDPLLKSLYRAVGRIIGPQRDALMGPDEVRVREWQALVAHKGEVIVQAASTALLLLDDIATDQDWARIEPETHQEEINQIDALRAALT